jgi:hypothetical protein
MRTPIEVVFNHSKMRVLARANDYGRLEVVFGHVDWLEEESWEKGVVVSTYDIGEAVEVFIERLIEEWFKKEVDEKE